MGADVAFLRDPHKGAGRVLRAGLHGAAPVAGAIRGDDPRRFVQPPP